MTDIEFQVLDELYFVSSYAGLAQATGLPGSDLVAALEELARKGYLKILFPDPDTETAYQPDVFRAQLPQAYFLATKAGLLAHNSR